MSDTERTLYDTAQMLHVAAGILSDNSHVLYGGSSDYAEFVSQMFTRAEELRRSAVGASTGMEKQP